MSVASLDDALAFWERFLGAPGALARAAQPALSGEDHRHPRRVDQGSIRRAAGGVILELLDYEAPDKRGNPEATANPGNIHLCLAVEDAGAGVEARCRLRRNDR